MPRSRLIAAGVLSLVIVFGLSLAVVFGQREASVRPVQPTQARVPLPQARISPRQGACDAQSPSFSLDAKYLAFECVWETGDVDLVLAEVRERGVFVVNVVEAKGEERVRGARGTMAVNASWHQDGVVVFEFSQGGPFRIHFMHPHGTSAAHWFTPSDVPEELTFPVSSSDGCRSAFVSDQTGNGDLMLHNRCRQSTVRVTHTAEPELFPTFSRDGKQLIFERKTSRDSDIHTLDLKSREEELVAGGPGDQIRPIEAARGQVLFFASDSEGGWSLQAETASSADPIILAEHVRLPTRSAPALSPDGEFVAWTTTDPVAASQVFVGRIDGSETIALSIDHIAPRDPDLGVLAGKPLLAYTALRGPDAHRRRVFLMDLSDQLASQ